jgi:hypothetical protein
MAQPPITTSPGGYLPPSGTPARMLTHYQITVRTEYRSWTTLWLILRTRTTTHTTDIPLPLPTSPLRLLRRPRLSG